MRIKIRPSGFTLIELLVVIIIFVIMVGVSFPFLKSMLKTTKGRSGQTSLSTAVNAVRIMNHRMEDKNDATFGDYSGTAVLVTPGGEIRFVINDRSALNSEGVLLESLGSNGYVDINGVEYLTLPKNAGIVGVVRRNSKTIRLIPPPFSIRFDEFGHMAIDQPLIYYDGDSDGRYEDLKRSLNYNPRDYDPRANFDLEPNQDTKRYELPFEAIETVNAVILFDNSGKIGALIDQGWYESGWVFDKLTDPDFSSAYYFSPHTGLVLRG